MGTFTALIKKIFTKDFCNTKVAGFGEIFILDSSEDFYDIMVLSMLLGNKLLNNKL